MSNPNIFAFAMILAWPLFALAIYKKKHVEWSVALLVLIPYLLLPVKTEINLPLLPPLDKVSVPILVLFAICKFWIGNFKWLPDSLMVRRLLLLLMVYPIFTFYTNRETLIYGDVILPGLSVSDLIKMIFENFTSYYLPFMIGYLYLANKIGQRTLLAAIVICAMWHTIPMLYEIRMSPQLHTKVYGFFPHQFLQAMRGDGFRPMVFLGHGLLVAFFTCTAVIAATTLWRINTLKRKKDPNVKSAELFKFAPGIAMYLFGILVLCKSLATMIYAIFLVPAVRFFSAKMQLRFAMVLMILAISFPVTRIYDVFPTQEIVNLFLRIDEERSSSLNYRFTNEDILVEKALSKSYFGWGTWGRNRVFDSSGKDIAVTDGVWIILLGAYGWAGFIVVFGFLSAPILMSYRNSAKFTNEEALLMNTSLCMILAVNLVDLLPNSSISLITPVIAGSIVGACEIFKREHEQKTEVT